ncbi:MAG: helix-turn-helix domain-containing protein [Pseudonocardiaceae bacterium]|nr:helix-turn-helix domain-containing protein [Pseudonocardiaceae bacterium]
MPNNSRAGDGALSSVDNALHLLQLVGQRKALRVAEAADELGVARSTAHRLLSSLRGRGFVMQDKPNAPYRPGPMLNEIGLAAIGRIDIRRVARAVLEGLRDETEETTSLALLEGRDIRFVDCVESPKSVRVGTRTGITWPAHCTAVGKAILAALPAADLARRYPADELDVRTADSLGSKEALDADLDRIRTVGYAINVEESEVGIGAIGACVHDLTGTPLTGIAVAVPTSRRPDPEALQVFAPAVTGAARTIEGLLRNEL